MHKIHEIYVFCADIRECMLYNPDFSLLKNFLLFSLPLWLIFLYALFTTFCKQNNAALERDAKDRRSLYDELKWEIEEQRLEELKERIEKLEAQLDQKLYKSVPPLQQKPLNPTNHTY